MILAAGAILSAVVPVVAYGIGHAAAARWPVPTRRGGPLLGQE
jgi:hypothetical protein